MVDMERIEKMFEQIDGNLQLMNTKLDSVVLEMKKIKEENTELKARIAKQEGRIGSLEREIRKKNLIIKGIEEKENENENEAHDKVTSIIQKIGVNINPDDIDIAKRIGKYNKQKKRPVLIKLTKESTKLEILKNAKTLKGTDIWINEDYSKEVQEERKRLIPKMREARDKGYKAQIKYNKLIINNEIYKEDGMEEEEEIESEEKSGNNSQKRKVNERSPGADNFEEQLRKITRTRKN